MNWVLLYEILYVVIVVLVCLRIIYDTSNTTKTLAYLLLTIFVPVLGIIVYFSFGINYRKRKMYSKKLAENDLMAKKLEQDIIHYSDATFKANSAILGDDSELAYMLAKNNLSALSSNNEVRLLVNGEKKFPEVLNILKSARNHIHIEYYIYDDDEIGRTIETLLIQKVKEGVTVRIIYDDFGSRSIRKEMVKRLRAGGVKIFPFNRILFITFANSINYRNHRKIIVVDGISAFIGGINISDRYINSEQGTKKLFWRDTHLFIAGPGIKYLQYLFLCDWNFCAKENLLPNESFFLPLSQFPVTGNRIVQIAASGPDSETPTILFSLLQGIHLAKKEILITTPYFIPGDSIMDALIVSALGGVSVKLLVPGVSDSVLVNAAARSYYEDLLKAGVEIYLYKKGFVHAKTLVSDRRLLIVGTANMDYRSFDLNFEVNAIVYDKELSEEASQVFFDDISDAEKIDPAEWLNRPLLNKLVEKFARLISPLL